MESKDKEEISEEKEVSTTNEDHVTQSHQHIIDQYQVHNAQQYATDQIAKSRKLIVLDQENFVKEVMMLKKIEPLVIQVKIR